MKLLFDNNLSPKLVGQLSEVYSESKYVFTVDLDRASDSDVWIYAQENGFCLVSKDSDFNELVTTKGFPPKVIWIRLGNCTTSEIRNLLETQDQVIKSFLADDSAGLLELF